LFFFFAGHAHDRQRIAVALDESIQFQAERLGIQSVGLLSLSGLHAPFLEGERLKKLSSLPARETPNQPIHPTAARCAMRVESKAKLPQFSRRGGQR
jgi:hypothetical protein